MTEKREPFLVECRTADEANAVDMERYRLSERLSEHRAAYIFVKRGGR